MKGISLFQNSQYFLEINKEVIFFSLKREIIYNQLYGFKRFNIKLELSSNMHVLLATKRFIVFKNSNAS